MGGHLLTQVANHSTACPVMELVTTKKKNSFYQVERAKIEKCLIWVMVHMEIEHNKVCTKMMENRIFVWSSFTLLVHKYIHHSTFLLGSISATISCLVYPPWEEETWRSADSFPKQWLVIEPMFIPQYANIEQLICLKSKTFFPSRLANMGLFPILILDWVGGHGSVNSTVNIPFLFTSEYLVL